MNLNQVIDTVQHQAELQRRLGYTGKLVVLINQSLLYSIEVELYQSSGDRQGDTITGNKIVPVQHIQGALVSVVPEWLALGLIRDTLHSARSAIDTKADEIINRIWSGE